MFLRVLAFDTTASACSIAVVDNNVALANKIEFLERGHAEILLPLIESVLIEVELEYEDLDLIAVTIGPGSFTGIRVGLATARSLALATDRPLVGLSNFDALANNIPKTKSAHKNVVVILESKRTDFYVSMYDSSLTCIFKPQALNGDDLFPALPGGPLIVIGDGVERARGFINSRSEETIFAEESRFVNATVLAKLAIKKFKNNGDTEKPVPLYLMPPAAKPQK